jgi:nitrogen fixation protein NifU and related proteins
MADPPKADPSSGYSPPSSPGYSPPSSPLDDHFRSPRNAGMLEGADLSVRVENPVCGDVLHLYLKLDGGGRVETSKFQVYGCPAAIAAGSVLTEGVRGRSAEEIDRWTKDDISTALGGLGADKVHAAVLARDAIDAALREWRRTRRPSASR